MKLLYIVVNYVPTCVVPVGALLASNSTTRIGTDLILDCRPYLNWRQGGGSIRVAQLGREGHFKKRSGFILIEKRLEYACVKV